MNANRFPDDFDLPVAVHHLFPENPQLHFREPAAQTEMDSPPEGQMLANVFAIYLDLEAQPGKAAAITEDIIIRRNRNLISWIKASRINYREIVVPWGALHLPGIETAILQMGFDLREHTYVPLISWTKVGHSLFGEGE